MSIKIFLDNYNNVCYPGQKISGRIECTFNRKKNLRAIRVKFRGCAKTFWNDSYSYIGFRSIKRSVQYASKEVYLNAEYNLVQGGEDFSLPAGKHVYPFSYSLPKQLPSSFEGTLGNIRYYVKAVVDRPWKFDYKAKLSLNVGSIIDLNFIPHTREPVAISDEKTISCWCKNVGALTFTISMPISGYVPGQYVNIRAYIKNLTNVNVECVKFKVIVTYDYITHRPRTHTRHDSGEIARCVESGISAHGEKSWTSNLRIPTNRIYPNLIPCSIIKAHYNLQAKVVLPYPHTNLELLHPITIGSVALSLGYPPPNNTNESPEICLGEEPPPPYLSGGGEDGSTPFAPMNEPSPYSARTTAPPRGVISSYELVRRWLVMPS